MKGGSTNTKRFCFRSRCEIVKPKCLNSSAEVLIMELFFWHNVSGFNEVLIFVSVGGSEETWGDAFETRRWTCGQGICNVTKMKKKSCRNTQKGLDLHHRWFPFLSNCHIFYVHVSMFGMWRTRSWTTLLKSLNWFKKNLRGKNIFWKYCYFSLVVSNVKDQYPLKIFNTFDPFFIKLFSFHLNI